MEKTTIYDIRDRFMEYNRQKGNIYGCPNEESISAIIVYKQSNFIDEYSEHDRSYRVTNWSGKAFFDGMISNSMFGDCLDGKDLGVALHGYDWDIEKCYFE